MKNYLLSIIALAFISCNDSKSTQVQNAKDSTTKQEPAAIEKPSTTLDTAKYDELMTKMANGDTTGRWPVKHEYPLAGALLPFNRIVAYYGNLYSNRMGALGKWPKEQMIKNLLAEVDKWNKVDSTTPAIPALHYIAVTAQGSAGKDGKWRYRMPHHQIDTILNWALKDIFQTKELLFVHRSIQPVRQ